MNIKKMLILSLFVTIMLSGCSSKIDEGYQKECLLDDNLGCVIVPDEWYFEEIDGWTYIRNASNDSIVAVEYEKCYHCYDTIDEERREYNKFFDSYTNYEFIEGLTGNSNLAQIDKIQFDYRKEVIEFYTLELGSRIDSSFNTSFVIFDTSISLDELKDLAKSYQSYESR